MVRFAEGKPGPGPEPQGTPSTMAETVIDEFENSDSPAQTCSGEAPSSHGIPFEEIAVSKNPLREASSKCWVEAEVKPAGLQYSMNTMADTPMVAATATSRTLNRRPASRR